MALQDTVRNIDSGGLARMLRIGMLAAALIGLCVVYFLIHFKGLGNEAAMDQAQVARSLISGKGFSTEYIRPLAIRQLSDAGKKIPQGNFPDFYNAPLFPTLEALVLYPIKKHIAMTPKDTLSNGDRALALLGIFLLLAGTLVWYAVGRMVFDHTLALYGAGLILVTNLMWQYALSGLPQHLLIVLFGLVTLCALRAKQAEEEDRHASSSAWIAGAGFGFGLMTLTHGVTAFMLPGFLLFCLFGFQSRITSFLAGLIPYLVAIIPWMVHNFVVCGNPLGISFYIALAGSGITESDIMRGVNTGISLGGGLTNKIRTGLTDQGAHLWEYLGLNIVVIPFFVSFLHPFRSSTASLWRWVVLAMWIGAVFGMTLFDVKGTVSQYQLHLIFLPVFILYGMAFLLVLWNRLNITLKPVRIAFLSVVFFVAAAPLLITLLAGQQARIQWPPYVPPFISVLGNWFKPTEILCSDMPWAVAWYADRKCVLLPETMHAFNELSDYGTLGSPVVGLYLTPISGNQDFLSLIKGKYKEWGPVIMRTVNLNDFLLKSFTPLPIDGECILYADRDRWAASSSK